MTEAIFEVSGQKELQRAAKVSRRVADEEDLCIGRDRVIVILLAEKSQDGEVVCQDADSARDAWQALAISVAVP